MTAEEMDRATFTTTLFKALDRADQVNAGGYEVECDYGWSESDDGRVLRLSDESDLTVQDQEITIEFDGSCNVTDTDGEEHTFVFAIIQPLTKEHMQ